MTELTRIERFYKRRKLEKAGLPVPDHLLRRGRGAERGRINNKALPQFRMNLSSSGKYNARQRFIKLGLPIPDWCAITKRLDPPKKNSSGMPWDQYLSMPWPDWATAKAVDACGDAWFFENTPRINGSAWSARGRVQWLGDVKAPKWQDSKVVKNA